MINGSVLRAWWNARAKFASAEKPPCCLQPTSSHCGVVGNASKQRDDGGSAPSFALAGGVAFSGAAWNCSRWCGGLCVCVCVCVCGRAPAHARFEDACEGKSGRPPKAKPPLRNACNKEVVQEVLPHVIQSGDSLRARRRSVFEVATWGSPYKLFHIPRGLPRDHYGYERCANA